MERHPVQLINITVDELHLKKLDHQEADDDSYPREFSLTVGRSDYDAEKKMISVRLLMEMMPEEGANDRPFEMRIAVAGHFEVDEDNFPIKEINKFAEVNAPIILVPYIREQAYALTIRAGVEPLIFPLITVPVFKIEKPSS
jgi:preprotein translocase subunit SecB